MTPQSNLSPSLPPTAVVKKRERKLPARGTQSAADTGYLRGLMAQETIY
jgi:hypothetical protein